MHCVQYAFITLYSYSAPSPATSDRLGELERDKVRLSEQLMAQQRDHLVREMDHLKKSKSKNLLKKGFKKLKGKIQVSPYSLHTPVSSTLIEEPSTYKC